MFMYIVVEMNVKPKSCYIINIIDYCIHSLAVQDLVKANELQPGDQTISAELQLLKVQKENPT